MTPVRFLYDGAERNVRDDTRACRRPDDYEEHGFVVVTVPGEEYPARREARAFESAGRLHYEEPGLAVRWLPVVGSR